eukprot:Opistho-2@47348
MGKWSRIAQELPPRTDNQCWRRYKSLMPVEAADHRMQQGVSGLGNRRKRPLDAPADESEQAAAKRARELGGHVAGGDGGVGSTGGPAEQRPAGTAPTIPVTPVTPVSHGPSGAVHMLRLSCPVVNANGIPVIGTSAPRNPSSLIPGIAATAPGPGPGAGHGVQREGMQGGIAAGASREGREGDVHAEAGGAGVRSMFETVSIYVCVCVNAWPWSCRRKNAFKNVDCLLRSLSLSLYLWSPWAQRL